MKIPFLDLQAQYAAIRDDVRQSVDRVLENQNFILGEEVERFEKAVAAFSQTAYAVGCASGSDALILALMAGGLKAGDGVLTVPFTFFATVGAIARLGARPFLIDINPDTYNMDPEDLRRFLQETCERRDELTVHKRSGCRIHSIMPVHLFGQCADMKAILPIAKE